MESSKESVCLYTVLPSCAGEKRSEQEFGMFLETLKQHTECFTRLTGMSGVIEAAGQRLSQVVREGGKILVCGNGGSAADAQHFAAELIGRFEQERSAWAAIALTTDTSILTAVGNDYGFADVFARQVQGLGRQGDALIGISTSGNSENVVRAVAEARSRGMVSIGLLGKDGGALKELVDSAVVISDRTTARIQEAHIFILHFWAMMIERRLAGQVP
jgi:D-sedoheptulose 7-phosphate isomerase